MRQNAVRSTASRRGSRLRDVLVIAEVSISLLLLIGAGLSIRTLQSLAAVEPGYDPGHVISFRVALPRLQPSAATAQPDARMVAAAGDILRSVASLPSVGSAAIASDAPLAGGGAVFYTAEGQPPMHAQTMPRAYVHRVSTSFFGTLRTPFLAGRAFTQEEIHRNADVAIVTENLVNRFWPGQNPIGKRVKIGGLTSPRPWLTIVGVISTLKYRGVPANPTADPDLFLVFNERSRDFSVLVRTSLPPLNMLAAVRNTLRQAEPSIIIYNSGTLEEWIGRETASPRFTGWLMAIFAAIALLLAILGIYGVTSYGVSRRTREIGLRIALGAKRSEVLCEVVGRGASLLAGGILMGLIAGVCLTRWIASLVYGVSPTDLLTFTAAPALLLMAGIVACLLPAARASRIDPAVALREE